MSFKNISDRFAENFREGSALRDAFERRWQISDKVEAWISVSGVSSDGLIHVSVQGNDRNYGTAYISAFTARELRQLAAIKDLVEDWKADKIPALPADCPREILELR